MSRQAALAKIHIAKKELHLDDDTYRHLLQEVAGVTSSKDLNEQGMKKVLERLQQAGFKPRAAPKTRALANDSQSRMIRGLWLQLHELGAVRSPDEAALGAFVKRMTGSEALQWLSDRKASVVIEHLKKWRKRAIHHPLEKLFNQKSLSDDQVCELVKRCIGEPKPIAQITAADMQLILSQWASGDLPAPPTIIGDAS